MRDLEMLGNLPTFFAIDATAVRDGLRPGASIQLDRTFFVGQFRARRHFEDPDGSAEELRTAWRQVRAIEPELDELNESALLETSRELRDRALDVPMIERLVSTGFGHAMVVPEWLMTGSTLNYGLRCHLFPPGSGPSSEEIICENVRAIVTDDDAGFAAYQGELHGYPPCCIEFFDDRSRDRPAPEVRSVRSIAPHLDRSALEAGPEGSIDDVLPDVLEDDRSSAFYAREFYPEPDCDRAERAGDAVREGLLSVLPARLVDDHWRLNVGQSILEAITVHAGGGDRPNPGLLGREHLLAYLPLRAVLNRPRYRS